MTCDTQAEIDRYWNALLEGGKPEPCGWLKDRYGVSWQITPAMLIEMMADPDRAKATRRRGHAEDGQARHRRAEEGRRLSQLSGPENPTPTSGP